MPSEFDEFTAGAFSAAMGVVGTEDCLFEGRTLQGTFDELGETITLEVGGTVVGVSATLLLPIAQFAPGDSRPSMQKRIRVRGREFRISKSETDELGLNLFLSDPNE